MSPSPYDLSGWWDVKHKHNKSIDSILDIFDLKPRILRQGIPRDSTESYISFGHVLFVSIHMNRGLVVLHVTCL